MEKEEKMFERKLEGIMNYLFSFWVYSISFVLKYPENSFVVGILGEY